MGEKVVALIKLRAWEQAAVIVDDLDQGRLAVLVGEPAMGRGVVLPKLADVGDLPAADGGAIKRGVMAAEDLGGGEAVRARR